SYPSRSMAPASTSISTLSLHDALPISRRGWLPNHKDRTDNRRWHPDLLIFRHERPRVSLRSSDMVRCSTEKKARRRRSANSVRRSEEHTSELQSRENLVCRLLLEKKKK